MDEQEQQQYEKQIGVEPNQEKQTLAPIEVQQTPTSPSHTKLIVGIVVVILVIAGAGGAYFFVSQRSDTEPVACTLEAKICPDGSAVGREGPSCEFAECPEKILLKPDVHSDLLPLSPDTEWSTPTQTTFEEYYDYKNLNEKGFPTMIPLIGHGIESTTATKANILFNYYENKLSVLGWEETLSIAADGPNGSRWAYTRGKEHIIFNTTWETPIDGYNYTIFWGKETADTSTWKTYRNEEFGFEFQYPEEWSALNQLDNAYSVDFWSAEGNAAAKIMSVNTGIDFSAIGVSYCGAYPKDERCEVLKTIGGNSVTIDWGVSGGANVMIGSQDGTYGVSIILHSINFNAKAIFRKIISTFKFIDPN